MKVSTIGLGYIGLPTAAVIASKGIDVVGVDINKHAVETINQGRIHIVESGLGELVRKVVEEKKLRAVLVPEPADYFLIAVPTPFQAEHMPDMSYVWAAAESIAPCLKKGDTIILESTSPVGSTEELAAKLAQLRPDLNSDASAGPLDIYIAYCPERVLPGRILEELVSNDRIVGGINPESSVKAGELYRQFVDGEILVTNAKTAEMAKLCENSFRDVNIAFANELSILSHKFGINPWELIELCNHHPRVNILQPGAGVGGHCIAVDPWFLVSSSPESAKLIKAAREVNDSKPSFIIARVEEAISNFNQRNDHRPKICCLGLAFKPDIDDFRESPALHIVKYLNEKYPGQVSAIEPNAHEDSNFGFPLSSLQDLNSFDIIAILVRHKEFKKDFLPKNALVIDAIGLLRQ
ncbi:UDP-N-acetyl-D-mannosamine dehydrogenase [Turicimonas muris]|uniref:UDP-N-acetyl-D-mannosamine dehydrogenase n=1 Tax=Turicimonas muris TaxID=1796652 RepID=UPI0032B23490